MNIREAKKSDLDAWSKLRTELWPDTPDGHVSELEEYFSGESIDIEQAFVLVIPDVDAEANEKVLGFIELNIRNFAEGSRNSKVPYVEGWIVDSSVQGRGYGRALMQRAEQWALELGFSELASDAEIENQKSIDIHKGMGFVETERVVCFLKKLS